MSYIKNSKGQAGAVFKILIGAIIGLAIFAIIVILIDRVDSQDDYLNSQIFQEKIKMAVENPTGEVFSVRRVEVKEGYTLTKSGLGNLTGLSGDCYEFDSELSQGVEINDDYIRFTKDFIVSFDVTCTLENTNNCLSKCTIKAYR